MVLTKEQIDELIESKEEIIRVCAEDPSALDEIHKVFDTIIDRGQYILNNVESIFLNYEFKNELDEEEALIVKDTLWNMFTCKEDDFMKPSDFEELIEMVLGIDKKIMSPLFESLLKGFFIPSVKTLILIRPDLSHTSALIDVMNSCIAEQYNEY